LKKWYLCKHDICVTILVTVFAFIIGTYHNKLIPDSIDKMITQLDWWVLILLFEWGFLTAMALVLVESLFVHLEHYWPWIVIVVFSTTGARFIGQAMLSSTEPGMVYETAWMTIVNGVVYFIFVVPLAILVFLIRRKILK